MARLIKVDRNGSKHYEGMVTCDRCGGKGYYAIAVCNGQPVLSPVDGGVCFKCGGAGKVLGKWIERTPEYQAKLDARRKARQEARQAELEAKRAEAERIRKEKEEKEEAERLAEEARIKAQKAISQYVGEIGQKVNICGSYQFTGSWEQKSFSGYGIETMYCHNFKDTDGNVFVWKTGKGLALNYGEPVEITGTVKAHSEYKDERQTVLTRCKVKLVETKET